MQTFRTHVRKMYFRSFFFFIFMLIALVVYSIAFNLFDNTDCERYNHTEALDGGAKSFGSKGFVITVCGAGVNNSLFNGDGMERVRLTIFDNQGELLARRYYKVFWDGQPGHEPLKVSKKSIIYQDDKEQKDHVITMPPTRLEWIRARLPL
ncbi:hypothetical protein ABNM12_19595 [Pseudomonas syringae]|nr:MULTISPECIES: hypothetical protein [Pseudomonas]KWS25193.1 hypothetical protein AL062_12505 [Pseudomonas syringae pv. syringae]KWS25759.1 hypothetical protein AL061_17415 [Pseudomonas syringae pv. syringae]MCH5490105.1 hypothetical protein [Pseudomonas syringae pv. syringae]MCH5552021.1 hypothetical protein [Pseudomonas syringae pv. syringae]MCH5555435.1 hypothetical protein [Pseudomonas syringae pv. syringae]